MRTSDFDYELPRELIATHPAEKRDESRLLVMERGGIEIEHRHFGDLPQFLRPNDLLVMNDSKVMKARLRGVRRSTGAMVEVLLQELVAGFSSPGQTRWTAFCRPAKKFRVGEMIDFAKGELHARVKGVGIEGERILEFDVSDILPLLERCGEIPLPPYIMQRRKETEPAAESESSESALADAERYQTIYAREQGSIAAPTAGLHFTPQLLERISDAGVNLAWVTLHVGAGTFKPVEVEDPASHPMHTEYYEVPDATAQAIEETRSAGGRIIAVGSTTVRTLESAWDLQTQQFIPGRQSTKLLILPGYKFQVVDAMITNFHLPRSSLLMMISAFAGYENVKAAYHEAIENRYRFYSYGDAMLIR